MLAIPVTPGDGFAFGTPRTLFAVNFKSGQGAGLVVTLEQRVDAGRLQLLLDVSLQVVTCIAIVIA